MIQSNALSQWPDLMPEEDHDNEDMILLHNNLFINLVDMELQEWIANVNIFDFNALDAINLLLGKRLLYIRKDLENWIINDKKVLFYKGKNYIPQDLELRHDIIWFYYNIIASEHPEEIKTFNVMKNYYWWPELWMFVKSYVKGCEVCQQFKINRSFSNPSYNPIPGLTKLGIEPRIFWTYTRCSNQLSYLALEFNQFILYLYNYQSKDTYSARHIQCHSLHARSTLWPWHDQISQSGNHVTDYIIQFQHR